jgi:hypothetical protein
MINFLKNAPQGLKTFDELYNYAVNLYKQQTGVFPEGIDKITIQRQSANLAEERGKVVDLPTSNIKNPEKTGPTVDLSKYTNEDLNKLAEEGDQLAADLSLVDQDGASTLPFREFQEKSARLEEINKIIRAAQESKLPDSYFDRPRDKPKSKTLEDSMESFFGFESKPKGEGIIPTTIEGKTKNMSAEEIMDFLMNKGKGKDTNIGTAPKTKKTKPKVDPELQAMDDQNEMFKDFSKRIKDMSPTERVTERLKDLKGVNLSELSGIEAQKIASEVIGRKGPFKTISSKGAKEVLGELEGIIKKADAEPDLGTKLKNFDGDPDAMAQGGRIGFSNGSTGVGVAGDQTEQSQPGGGQMDMPRNLGFQPIFPMPQTNIPGSGGMSEFRKFLGSVGAPELGMGFNFPVGQRGILGVGVAPSGNVGAQLRLPFKDGSKPKSRARRNFLKLMAGLGSIPFVGPLFKGAKTVEKAATAVETVPPYFFQLVNKIRQFGTDITSPGVTTESRQRVTQYEIDGDDYVMTENLSTGKIEIEKEKTGGVQFYDEYGEMDVADGIISKEYMTYKPKEVDVDPKTGKKIEYPEEYEEVTATPSGDDGTDMEAISGLNDDTVKQIVKETGDLKGVKKYYPDVELTPREQLDKRIQEIIKQRNKKAGGGVAYMLGE